MGITTFKPDRIKVVFFDINETLLDPESTFRQAFMQVWKDTSGRWETDVERPSGEEVWAAYRKEAAPGRAYGRMSLPYAEQQKRNAAAFAAALRPWGIRLPDHALNAFFHRVSEQQERRPVLYPGAAEALSALAKSYKVAIISNGMQEKQTRRLRAAGQLPPLREDRMFFSASVGVRKPHPAIFRHALERIGYRPDQAVMVGNSWSKDVLGAIQVHINAVWFCPGRKQKHFRRKVGSARIHVVQSMEQLLSLFELPSGPQQPSK
ncbi:HAD family hydrolase [Gorillibacterium sp. sgz5001074]|uniref:HAD family hydrolase n=1 Tax=Gorillibacterium sp. sgz5001074 TaxID=3446695 RepID=UPI003F6627AD